MTIIVIWKICNLTHYFFPFLKSPRFRRLQNKIDKPLYNILQERGKDKYYRTSNVASSKIADYSSKLLVINESIKRGVVQKVVKMSQCCLWMPPMGNSVIWDSCTELRSKISLILFITFLSNRVSK